MTIPATDLAVGAVVLAAGLSSRMGQPKQLLPWSGTSMLHHVVNTLLAGGAQPSTTVVVIGHEHEAILQTLKDLPVQTALNPDYADGSMLHSLQVGLSFLNSLPTPPQAILVALGDQPQIQSEVARHVIERWRLSRALVVAPSFNKKRGHPMLFSREFWPHVFAAPSQGSPRDLLANFADKIDYLSVESDDILRDIDTPAEYQQELGRRV